MNPHELQMSKALMLLDRGMADRAESMLRGLLDGDAEADAPTRVRALVILGDLLIESDRIAEARLLLEQALRIDVGDDLVDAERDRARELLAGPD